MQLLHVYSQAAEHDEAYLIGNRQALAALRAALDRLLTGMPQDAVSLDAEVNDGEGYALVILMDDTPWDGPSWTQRAVPYVRDYAQERRPEAMWPTQEYMARVARRSEPDASLPSQSTETP